MRWALMATAIFLALLANEQSSEAATVTVLTLPDGTSQDNFSISTTFPATLTITPSVAVVTDGCPGLGCSNSYWDVSVTAEFYNNAYNSILVSDVGLVSENCSPTDCTVPRSLSFSIPADATNFELINNVSVGGGWSFESANEIVDDPPATPIPTTLPLFLTGLGIMALLRWRRTRNNHLVDQV